MDTSTLGADSDQQEAEFTVFKEEPKDVEDEWEEEQSDDKHELLLEDPEYDVAKTEPEENFASSPVQTVTETDNIQNAIQESQTHGEGTNLTSVKPKRMKRKRSRKRLFSKKPKRQTSSTRSTTTVDSNQHHNYDMSSMQEPNDIIVKPESMLICPPSLQNCTEDEIFNAFSKCHRSASIRPKQTKFNYMCPRSMYGKIFMLLTDNKTSTWIERKYLCDLWNLKYKSILTTETDLLRQHFRRFEKSRRDKYYRRLKSQQKQLALQSVEVVYNSTDENNETLTRKRIISKDAKANSADTHDPEDLDHVRQIMDSVTRVPVSKTETESDQDDQPSSPIHHVALGRNDLKLRLKPVVALARLEPTTLAKRVSVVERTLRCRKRISRKKYTDDDDSSFTSGSNLDIDDDYVPCDDPVPEKAVTLDEHGDTEIAEGHDTFKLVCKICGRPLDKYLVTFHMRTHLNYEEQKQFILKRKENMKEIEKRNAQNEISSSFKKTSASRLQQLQWLITGRERRIEQMLQHQKKAACPKKDKKSDHQDQPKVSRRKVSKNKVDGKYVYGPVQCAHCGKVLTTIYLLRCHEVCVHGIGEGNSSPCFICGRPFTWKKNRAEHLQTHFSSEEYAKFLSWSGNIEEFINRLNTGEDLEKPPTQKAKWRKSVLAVRKKTTRRPKKHDHHLYEKKDLGSRGGDQLESTEAMELQNNNALSNVASDMNELNTDISRVADSQQPQHTTTVDVSEFPAISLEPSTGEFSWNTFNFPYQDIDGFHTN